ALPLITVPITIDGTTQPGYAGAPLIEVRGPAGGAAAGLDLQGGSSGSTIRGLIINNFTSGIAVRIQSSNNDGIAGNYLGTNAAGTAALGNQVGVYIQIGTNNRIGGTVAADRNIISGNSVDGIQLDGSAGGNNANIVRGNYIGLNAAGTAGLGNAGQGVAMLSGLTNATMGATAVGGANLLSAKKKGVVNGAATQTGILAQGNLIGPDSSGTVAIGNTAVGVDVASAVNNTIG